MSCCERSRESVVLVNDFTRRYRAAAAGLSQLARRVHLGGPNLTAWAAVAYGRGVE